MKRRRLLKRCRSYVCPIDGEVKRVMRLNGTPMETRYSSCDYELVSERSEELNRADAKVERDDEMGMEVEEGEREF